MAKSDKCSDCANNVEGQCKAPSLQGSLENDYQSDVTSKTIPVEVARGVRILCSTDARWFAHK